MNSSSSRRGGCNYTAALMPANHQCSHLSDVGQTCAQGKGAATTGTCLHVPAPVSKMSPMMASFSTSTLSSVAHSSYVRPCTYSEGPASSVGWEGGGEWERSVWAGGREVAGLMGRCVHGKQRLQSQQPRHDGQAPRARGIARQRGGWQPSQHASRAHARRNPSRRRIAGGTACLPAPSAACMHVTAHNSCS